MLFRIGRGLARLLVCYLFKAHRWHLIAGVPIIKPAGNGSRQLHMCTRCLATTVTTSHPVRQATPRPPFVA